MRPSERTTEWAAVVSLVLGLMSPVWWVAVFTLSLVVSIMGAGDLASESVWMVLFGMALAALPVLAMAFGGIALSRIRVRPDVSGRGLAWAGIVLGMVGLVPSAWFAVAISTESDPGTVTITGTAVYGDPATFEADSNQYLATCTPRKGDWAADPTSMFITGGVITTETLYDGEVGEGSMSGGRCLVGISVTIEYSPLIAVNVGPICAGSNSAIAETTSGGEASFGTIEVTNC